MTTSPESPGNPGRARRTAAFRVAAGLVCAHVIIVLVNVSPLMQSVTVWRLLDVNREATVVAWFSSATLLIIAGLMAAAGWTAEPSRRDRAGWWVIGSAFAVLSIDETASLHEIAGEIAANYVTVDWLPGPYIWVIVVAPLAAIGAILMMRWLGRTLGWRSTSGRMAVLAVTLWLAVPVFEALAPALDQPKWLSLTEELAEGFGEALMTGAMLSYLARIRTVTRTS